VRKLLCALIALAPLALATGCSEDPGKPQPSTQRDMNAVPKGGDKKDVNKAKPPTFSG